MFDFNNGYTPVAQAAVQQHAAGTQNTNINAGTQPTAGYTPVAGNFGNTQAQGSFFRNPNGSFNTNNLKLGLGAIKTLGSLWMSFKQNKLAEKSLALQEKAFETNLHNQTTSYNTALEDRIRARYHTEGRSEQADSYIDNHKL